MTVVPPVAVEVTRRDLRDGRERVESVHRAHVAVVDGGGTLVGALGDADLPTFVRSSVKPFQATASLEALGPDAGGLGSDEVAIAWASHRGEPRHVAAVTRLLARSGTAPDRLTCPPASGEEDPGAAPDRIHHNCSGKHALFALAGPALDCPHGALLDPDAPLQRRVLEHLAEVLGPASAVAVDGCGAPAVAARLSDLARGYARLLQEPRYARVVGAGLEHPFLVGGTGRPETALLAAGVLAKPGAEGVFALAWRRPSGGVRAVALKAEDGAARGAGALAVALAVADGNAVDWAPPPPLGGGRPQGQVRAVGVSTDLFG